MNKLPIHSQFEEKPYNMCLNCVHIGKRCDGPNFLAMDIRRLCEWCRLRKEYLHGLDPKWTNAFIAEKSGLSKVSVDRFLSGSVDDLKGSTISKVLKVLVNGSWGQYPCAMESFDGAERLEIESKLETAKEDYKHLQASLDATKQDYQEQIDFLKEQIKVKDEQITQKNRHLAERAAFMVRKDKAIRMLSVGLTICVIIIITTLIIDILNPNLGFLWLL